MYMYIYNNKMAANNNNRYVMNLTDIKETKSSYIRTINLHRRDKKPIEIDEIRRINNKYIPENSKSIIRGLNSLQWWTLKSLNEDLNVQNYEDYFQGRVSDSTKFEKFYQLSITVVQEK